MFGGLGLPEILILGGVALLVFGPKRLPELAKGLGKGIRDFKKALEGRGEDHDDQDKLPPAGSTAAPHSVAQTPASDLKKESKSASDPD